MAKVGQVVTIPTGSYCNVTLDSGEKIVVSHQADAADSVARARLTVDRLRLPPPGYVELIGFSSETVVQIDLDTHSGEAALAALTREAGLGAADCPLRALVAYVVGCASVAAVVARYERLLYGL